MPYGAHDEHLVVDAMNHLIFFILHGQLQILPAFSDHRWHSDTHIWQVWIASCNWELTLIPVAIPTAKRTQLYLLSPISVPDMNDYTGICELEPQSGPVDNSLWLALSECKLGGWPTLPRLVRCSLRKWDGVVCLFLGLFSCVCSLWHEWVLSTRLWPRKMKWT